MAQKMAVIKVWKMTDDKTKHKAIEAASDISGVESVAADVRNQKVTVVGEMDTVAVAQKLKKKLGGRVDILALGPHQQPKTSV